MKDKKVMIGLSGGINSMALLCWLAEQPNRPTDLWLFYAHFKEHSPDTWDFVQSGMEYAKNTSMFTSLLHIIAFLIFFMNKR